MIISQEMFLRLQIYADHEGSVTVMDIKKSAGVTPQVNLRNPLQAGNKTHKGVIQTLGFETSP